MIRRPPSANRCPYTWLFRADHGMAWNGRRAGDVVTSLGDAVTGIETVADLIAGRGVLLDVGRAVGTDGELPDGFADRKSTRLNSSHANISYDVFCLKTTTYM